MALDVYVGTLTRFYRREWENVMQRLSREQGYNYNMIYAGGEPEEPLPAEDIRQAVQGWCKGLSQGLQPHGFGPISWSEDDQQPYFTDRPAWDGYSGLLVWAAHTDHPDLPLPTHVPETWTDDPAFQRSTDRESKTRYRTILEPELWLPTEFPFVFNAPTLTAENGCIGSVFTLKQQLDDLFQQTSERFKALKHTPKVELPAPKKTGFLAGLFGKREEPKSEPEQEKAPLAEAADIGLSVFRDLANKACEHRLPLLLHY